MRVRIRYPQRHAPLDDSRWTGPASPVERRLRWKRRHGLLTADERHYFRLLVESRKLRFSDAR